MKKLFLLLSTVVGFVLNTQGQAIDWVKNIGEGVRLEEQSVISDGTDLIVFNILYSPTTFGTQTLAPGRHISKFNNSGDLIWNRSMHGADRMVKIEPDAYKNIIVAGQYRDSLVIDKVVLFKNNHVNQRGKLFILKFDASGKILWAQNSVSRFGDFEITLDQQNNIYVSSIYFGTITLNNFTINAGGTSNVFLAKYDSFGNLQWLNNVNNPTINDTGLIRIIGGKTNVFTATINGAYPGLQTINIRKFNSSGVEEWAQTGNQASPFVQIESAPSFSIALDSAENVHLFNCMPAGTTATFGNTTLAFNALSINNIYQAKLSSAGNWLWAKLLLLGKTPTNYFSLSKGTRNSFNIVRNFYPWSPSLSMYTNISKDHGFFTKVDTSGNILTNILLYTIQYIPFQHGGSFGTITTDDYGNNYLLGVVRGTMMLGPFTLSSYPSTSGSMHSSKNFIVKLLPHSYKLSGTLFIDSNQNGIKDTGEQPFPDGIVEINPGPYYASPDSDGKYQTWLPSGNYQMSSTTLKKYYTFVPQNNTFSLANSGPTQVRDLAFVPALNSNDVSISVLNINQSRPGFPVRYRLTFKNEGTTVLSDSLIFKYDNTNLQYDSATITPAASQTSSLKWFYQNLQPNESRSINLSFTAFTSTLRGDTLQASAWIKPTGFDLYTKDNYDTVHHVISGSFDPNDKQVNLNRLTPAQANGGQLLDYIIRFQNTGNDTAFTVVIRDSISTHLALPTFEMLSANHPYTYRFVGKNIIEWEFKNILLPDSNRNEAASHGFIRYRMQPKNNLKAGDEISGRAAIFFDYNAPVYTNFALTRIAETRNKPNLGDFSLYPNPAKNYVTVAADLKKQTTATVTLVNLLGQIVNKVSLPVNNQLEYKLPLNNLPKGVYVVQLETETGVQAKRLVIQ